MNVIEYKITADRREVRAGDLYRLDGTVPEKYKDLVEGREPYEVVQVHFVGSEIEMKFASDEKLGCGHRFEFEGHDCVVMAWESGIYFARGFLSNSRRQAWSEGEAVTELS
jgi:hypothetical protein